MANEIISFEPFFATYENYEGRLVSVTFSCPFCGSHSCKRSRNSSSLHFFEGHFRCSVCCKGSLDGLAFCYYSSCFVTSYSQQLTLFD